MPSLITSLRSPTTRLLRLSFLLSVNSSIAFLRFNHVYAAPFSFNYDPLLDRRDVERIGLGGEVEGMADEGEEIGEPTTPPADPTFWWKLGISILFVILGGIFAGLTLGLMGLDQTNLRVISTSSDEEKERKQAIKVLKLMEKGRHWVLVVLLLSNVVVNESLPIFLDSILGGGAAAIVLSTAMIVIFGEIIPQSVCNRYGLAIGSFCTPFVLLLMYVSAPLSWPIAKLLDWCLGGEEAGTSYKKAELRTFVKMHKSMGEEPLNDDEITIISAVLELQEKRLEDVMTPIEDCYTLGADDILDTHTVTEILAQGYSRVPIHEAGHSENFIGMLLIKQLITYDPDDAKPVRDFHLAVLPETEPSVSCLDALNFFQTGRSHMLLVSKTPGSEGGGLGIVSLEDVIEELIGEEIVDESDVYVDVHNKVKVARRPAIQAVGHGQGFSPFLKGMVERRRTQRVGGMVRRPSKETPPTPDTPSTNHIRTPPNSHNMNANSLGTSPLRGSPTHPPNYGSMTVGSPEPTVTTPLLVSESMVGREARDSSGQAAGVVERALSKVKVKDISPNQLAQRGRVRVESVAKEEFDHRTATAAVLGERAVDHPENTTPEEGGSHSVEEDSPEDANPGSQERDRNQK